jgi:hypothetical protein
VLKNERTCSCIYVIIAKAIFLAAVYLLSMRDGYMMITVEVKSSLRQDILIFKDEMQIHTFETT